MMHLTKDLCLGIEKAVSDFLLKFVDQMRLLRLSVLKRPPSLENFHLINVSQINYLVNMHYYWVFAKRNGIIIENLIE